MELVDRTAGFLSDAGYRVIEVEPPPITEPAATWFTAGITELKLTLDATVRKHGSTELQDVFDAYYDMGTILDLAGYRQEFSERTRMMREWSVFLNDRRCQGPRGGSRPVRLGDLQLRPQSARISRRLRTHRSGRRPTVGHPDRRPPLSRRRGARCHGGS